MSRVTVRYWAAAKEAAGHEEDIVDAGTLADALNIISCKREGNPHFRTILSYSSFLVDGSPATRQAAESVPLADGSEIEVLPPFAGG